MNKVILIGNLTREPELRETPNGAFVCNFGIAVKRDYSEGTDFFNVTVWQNQAKNCKEYLKKGSKVAVYGSVQNRSYEDSNGEKKTVTEIIAREVEFLTPKQEENVVTSSRVQLEPTDDNQLPF